MNGLGDATSSWNVLGSLFLPLFDRSRIANESQAMRDEAKASLMDLHEVVLLALKEVENAFDTERDLARQIEALDLAVTKSETSSNYYEDRYKQGLSPLENLLTAKEQE